MKNISLFIISAKKGEVPIPWSPIKNEVSNTQRMYYIKSGKGCLELPSGERCEFSPGKIYLLPANLEPKLYSSPDNPIDHIYYNFLSSPPVIADKPIEYEVKLDSPLYHQIMAADRILHDYRDREFDHPVQFSKILEAAPGSQREKRQIIYELLHLTLLLLSSEHPIPFIDDRIITDSLEYIHEHYSEPISLDEMASRVGLNKVYFIRRFKKIMNVTPYSYLRAYRLMIASQLLHSGLTLAQTAERVGYQNTVSLYNALRADNNSLGSRSNLTDSSTALLK